MKRLLEIQQKLKAPKSQRNNFGNYNYRSCEDIIEAVKPLLAEKKLVLVLWDEIVCMWEREYSKSTKDWVNSYEKWCRFYVKATATLYDETWKLIAQTSAYAREEEEKKWQDWSQITGSSSSYARKYALNWLFAIDDWVDSDTTNKWEEKKEVKKEVKKEEKKEDWEEKPWFNKPDLERLQGNKEYLEKFKTSEDLIKDIEKYYRVSKEMKMKIADVWAE